MKTILRHKLRRGRNHSRHLVQSTLSSLDGQHGSQQTASVFVTRIGHHLGGRPRLDDLPGVHHRDAMGELRHQGQVMGDEDHSESQFLAEVVQQFHHLLLHRHVEGRGRFVGDEQLRITGQRHSDKHTLALST